MRMRHLEPTPLGTSELDCTTDEALLFDDCGCELAVCDDTTVCTACGGERTRLPRIVADSGMTC